MNEMKLLASAGARGRRYTEASGHRRVFPSDEAIAVLAHPASHSCARQ